MCFLILTNPVFSLKKKTVFSIILEKRKILRNTKNVQVAKNATPFLNLLIVTESKFVQITSILQLPKCMYMTSHLAKHYIRMTQPLTYWKDKAWNQVFFKRDFPWGRISEVDTVRPCEHWTQHFLLVYV